LKVEGISTFNVLKFEINTNNAYNTSTTKTTTCTTTNNSNNRNMISTVQN